MNEKDDFWHIAFTYFCILLLGCGAYAISERLKASSTGKRIESILGAPQKMPAGHPGYPLQYTPGEVQ